MRLWFYPFRCQIWITVALAFLYEDECHLGVKSISQSKPAGLWVSGSCSHSHSDRLMCVGLVGWVAF